MAMAEDLREGMMADVRVVGMARAVLRVACKEVCSEAGLRVAWMAGRTVGGKGA